MDKLAVAKCFSDAAAHYDQSAHLQRTVADRLLEQVQYLNVANGSVVADLGTGTGYCLPTLLERFKPKTLYGLDLSHAMLRQAQSRTPQIEPIQADLEAPPFAPKSLDLAVSSLAVQWLDAPEPFVSRMSNALKPGGYLALATLGPRTLGELKHAWSLVDDTRHVNTFHSAVDWLDALWDSSLEIQLWREERLEVRYESPMQLLQELKGIGANHVERSGSAKGSGLRRMLKQYQGFRRSDGRYPATWDVFYLIVRKPS